ncbi:MAG TPA: ABC transporter permease [Actinomycetota bacterium]|nr:ABC transporter permease [Actinomycetota bacterium]
MSARTEPSIREQAVRTSGVARALSHAVVMAKRHLVQIPRIPELIVFATIQPIMFVVLFRYVFAGSIDVGGDESYINYLMAGIFVQTVAFGSVATGIGLAADLQLGLIDRFRSLPMAPSAVLTGRTMSDLVRNMFVVGVMIVVGLLVGFSPDGSVLGWINAIGLLLLLSFTFSWVGAAVGLSVRSVEVAQSAGFIWLFPLTFASSAFVNPVNIEPEWLQAFVEHQPITHIVNAVRAQILGPEAAQELSIPPDSEWKAVVWLLAILVVMVPVSVRLYRRAAARPR